MYTGQKDATRDDSAGDLRGVYDCGGDHHKARSTVNLYRRGDDEVIHLGSRDAIRGDNAVELAGAVAVHSVSSRLRAGRDSSRSRRRSRCGLVYDEGSTQIAVSI